MKSKKLGFQIIAWCLCLAIAYRIYGTVHVDKLKRAERIAELQLQAANMEQSEGEKIEAQEGIYDKLYSDLENPTFICWGDSAMAGSRESSLSKSLQKIVDDNLYAQLSKTFSRVLEKDGRSLPSSEVVNMGVTNEGMRQILVRAGVNVMDLGEGIEIPSETDPVTVRLMDEEAWNSKEKDAQLKFSKQRDVSFGKAWISGIKGSLITTDDWFDSSHPRYAFIRDKDGDWQRIGSGTEVEIESATKYLGDIPIFFFENDSGRSVEGFVSDIEKLVKRYANTDISEDDNVEESDSEEDQDTNSESENSYNLPFVVICTTNEDSNLDKALISRFGSRYIRNNGYAGEMNDRVYKKLAQQVYDNLDEQGCFTDIKAKILLAVQEANGL